MKRSEKDNHKDDKGIYEKLEVTIIPVDEEPYTKTISIPYSLIGKNYFFFYSQMYNFKHLGSPNNTNAPS